MSALSMKKKIEEVDQLKWGGDDAFTHTLIVGPTRCGKSATIIKNMIYQLLIQKKQGKELGLTVLEPKGDIAQFVADVSHELDIPYTHIDPLQGSASARINVMQGYKMDVAEATVTVLKSLFGKQEAFFATVQELSARNITLLLKELYQDNVDIIDVLKNLRDSNLLASNVEKLKQNQGNTDLVQFFENELLGSMKDRYAQYVIGLRSQLENITGNEYLRPIITGDSSIDIDEHLEKGGVLGINSALGLLGSAGDAFGMFLSMHLQLATFRRKGTERTRIPHYLIIDEYSRYINPQIERWLSISAEYRVAGIFAIQSLGQLEVESGNTSARAMKKAILTSCRNKIAFGGLSAEDAKEISIEMGEDQRIEKMKTYGGMPLQDFLPQSYRLMETEKARFHYTLLMDGLPRFHYIHKMLQEGAPQVPGVCKGNFVPRDWREQLTEIRDYDIKN